MWTLSKNWFIATFLALVLCIGAIQAFNVEMYEAKHFKGKHAALDVRGCTNIPLEWDDVVSSIEPSQCVIIFKHPNCQGPRVRVEPAGFGTAYLREINFEDKLSSLAPCSIAAQRDEY